MIGELGQVFLIVAFVAALVQAWGGLGPSIQPRLVAVAAAWHAVSVCAAIVLLGCAFVLNDFSLVYVVQNGHSDLPLAYRIAAVWGGHEGSMLLWLAAMSLWSAAALRSLLRRDAAYAARTLGVLGIVAAGVGGFVLFTSNPFARLLPAIEEGMSLNPLLQDPGMALHPPLLYLGYVGTAVPFAMTVAALLAEPPRKWIRWLRPYCAVALAFLSLGIGLGSWWAYYELGWGGWWFWDPVENASLMPWLALAALLHVRIARERHGRFPYWTATLAVGAFVLSLLGTFLVRSGVLTSVHAFASDPRRGSVMLALIAATLLGSLALAGKHSQRLLPERQSPAPRFLSRDMAIAINNLLLVAACGCVLLGTLYPLVMDALQLGKLSVGAPYFDAVMPPLLLPAALLLIPAIRLRWKQDQASPLLRRLLPALVVMCASAIALPFWLTHVFGHASLLVVVALLVALGIGVSTLDWAVARAFSAKLDAAGTGMALAHLGVAVFVVGVAMVKGYGVERDVRLAPGETHSIADCQLAFDRLGDRSGPNYEARVADFTLTCNGTAHRLTSEKRTYGGFGMPITESAIEWSLTRDIYVALGTEAGSPGSDAWSLRVQYKPFVRWIWIGVVLMAIGCFCAAGQRVSVRKARREKAGIVPAHPSTEAGA